ncbi:DUF349 domain-containing protein [Marinoscillum sp. MHG1-6]|uniref:DUF349 domain-containing protein n=1 Tax=Marinoscillum sp. MHG1-6 TaxID=2959627 RepID=UPI002156F7B9|nr:DUF349 domain-containing protein [Marinoscillum sp. MHG1-6]
MAATETAYGYVKDGKVFLKSWGDSQEREIGEVKDENPEASLQYFEERFEDLVTKVQELEALITESTNKGSFLMKLLHMKEVLGTHDGLGDYQLLLDRLTAQESLINDIIAKNREKNTEIKKALIEEVKVAVEKINWKEATVEIHDIKTRWIKTGNAVEEENEQLEEAFWSVVQAFFEKKKAFYEDKRRLMDKAKESYAALVEEAKKINNLHGKERFQKVKQLKDEWAALGNIPKEEYSPLIDEFNKLLKPGVKHGKKPVMDIQPIQKSINQMIEGEIPIDGKALDQFKGALRGYNPVDHKSRSDKRELFAKMQLLKERTFIQGLARKKRSNYSELSEKEQADIQIKLLEDLLRRDKEDLKQYSENAEKFATASGQISPLVEKQLHQQKSKVAVKEQLLALLKKS